MLVPGLPVRTQTLVVAAMDIGRDKLATHRASPFGGAGGVVMSHDPTPVTRPSHIAYTAATMDGQRLGHDDVRFRLGGRDQAAR